MNFIDLKLRCLHNDFFLARSGFYDLYLLFHLSINGIITVNSRI